MSELVEFVKSIEKKIIVDKDNGREILFNRGNKVTQQDIDLAEERLGLSLPESYKDFIRNFGDANFFGLKIFHPNELYSFDSTNWEMEGFIPYAIDFIERYHAFRPVKNITEYHIYVCSHDPFGYGKVADNFHEWCILNYKMMENFEKGEKDFNHPFLTVHKDIMDSWKRYKSTLPKKWWQFW